MTQQMQWWTLKKIILKRLQYPAHIPFLSSWIIPLSIGCNDPAWVLQRRVEPRAAERGTRTICYVFCCFLILIILPKTYTPHPKKTTADSPTIHCFGLATSIDMPPKTNRRAIISSNQRVVRLSERAELEVLSAKVSLSGEIGNPFIFLFIQSTYPSI